MIGWAGGEDVLRGDANTQPFRYRRWLFAQEGPGPSDELYAELMPQLLQHIPDYLRRNIRGRSPAEHVFHLFLSMLHDAGTLDDPNLAPPHIRRAAARHGRVHRLAGVEDQRTPGRWATSSCPTAGR